LGGAVFPGFNAREVGTKDTGFGSIESHADIPNTMPGTTLIVAEKK